MKLAIQQAVWGETMLAFGVFTRDETGVIRAAKPFPRDLASEVLPGAGWRR